MDVISSALSAVLVAAAAVSPAEVPGIVAASEVDRLRRLPLVLPQSRPDDRPRPDRTGVDLADQVPGDRDPEGPGHGPLRDAQGHDQQMGLLRSGSAQPLSAENALPIFGFHLSAPMAT
jgi:hypothetical protein